MRHFTAPTRGPALPLAVVGSLAVVLSAAPPSHADTLRTHASPKSASNPVDAHRAAVSVIGSAETGAETRHTVVAGDTVSGIASRFGVRTEDVLALNGLAWDSVIHPGQELVVRAAAPTTAPAPAPAPAASHTVVAGDTISGIAERHEVSVESILAANGLQWSSIIYPGQTLALPLAATPAAATTPAPIALSVPLDDEQSTHARHIIAVGRELGVPDRGIAIALGAAMQESWIRNLDWGDRDSLGLFQQRPSTGWGTEAQLRTPDHAIRVFYGGPADPNGSATRGLLDIPGWEQMSFAEAAQAVQISAYPDRYGAWEHAAYEWLAALG